MLVVKTLALILEQVQALEEKLGKLLRLPNWHRGGVNVASATIQFTNAQVVYADGNNYIVRENNQALDILNTSLNLKQGQYLTGTVVLNVNYNSGILTTSDVTGLTDDTKLTFSGDELNEPLPILCATIAEMTNHPGDLVMIENRTCYKSYLGFYIYEYQPKYKAFYFSNEAGLVKNKNYHITAWYNSVLQSYNYPQGKVIKAEPAITTLAPPTISGEAAFTSSTTVTIKSSESVALIYYTLDGTEPTTESILYKDSFVLDKTTTVKAIAVYKTVTSEVASMDFHLIDLSAPKTIRDLAQLEKNLESVTVRFDNAQVVYSEGKNYILRENIEDKNYALDVLNTQLPLQVGATVSGTVKLQVNFKPNPAENNGVLTTADIAETINHNLAITSGASVMPIPLEVSIKEVRNYPGDLLVVADGEWMTPYYGDPFIYGSENPTWPYGATYYVYVSNHSDYTYSNSDKPDVMLWYNDVYTEGMSPLAKIIGEKETAEYKVTEVGWATFIVPFDCDKPDGLTIYECTSVNEDGKLVVEERDYLKANTPYLLKGGEANQILEGYAAKHAGTYTNGVMTGVYSDQEAPANSYILLNHPDEAGLAFYFVPDGITAYVDANRCYVNPRDGGLKSILFPDDETNGVTNANALDSTLVDVYTTAGVKVKHQVEMGKALNDLPAGLYIINNKKIVKK
jgi:PA14 domain protein